MSIHNLVIVTNTLFIFRKIVPPPPTSCHIDRINLRDGISMFACTIEQHFSNGDSLATQTFVLICNIDNCFVSLEWNRFRYYDNNIWKEFFFRSLLVKVGYFSWFDKASSVESFLLLFRSHKDYFTSRRMKCSMIR